MNRKLISLAVAGALGAPGAALAQASTVQVYGTLVMNYLYVDQGGNGKLKTDMINTHDTNLGFKGEEALGGGLSGWFQCESSMDVTAGGTAGNSWCGRNSAFGMKGNMGNIYVGQWDTPMKITMANFRPFSTAGVFGMGQLMWGQSANGIPNPVPVTLAGAPTNGANSTSATSFTRRPSNSINYRSPNFSGFEIGLTYTAANEATNQTSAAVAAKPRLWSTGVTYHNGPLILGGGYETHRNFNPGLQATYTGGTDRNWNLGAAYTFMGTLKVMGMYGNKKYELAGGDMQLTSYSIHADWAFSGPHRIRAGWTRAADTKGSFNGAAGNAVTGSAVGVMTANAGQGGTSGTLASIQYAYAFSKRTELNFGYARIGNSVNSSYVLQSTVGANKGQDQSAWNLGVKHSF